MFPPMLTVFGGLPGYVIAGAGLIGLGSFTLMRYRGAVGAAGDHGQAIFRGGSDADGAGR